MEYKPRQNCSGHRAIPDKGTQTQFLKDGAWEVDGLRMLQSVGFADLLRKWCLVGAEQSRVAFLLIRLLLPTLVHFHELVMIKYLQFLPLCDCQTSLCFWTFFFSYLLYPLLKVNGWEAEIWVMYFSLSSFCVSVLLALIFLLSFFVYVFIVAHKNENGCVDWR